MVPPQHSIKREASSRSSSAVPTTKFRHKSVSQSSQAVESSAVSGSTILPELRVPSILHHIRASKQQPFTDPNTGATFSTPKLSDSAKKVLLKHNLQIPVCFYLSVEEGCTQRYSGQKEQRLEHEKQHLQAEERELQKKGHQLQHGRQQLQHEIPQLCSELKEGTEKELKMFFDGVDRKCGRSDWKGEDQIGKVGDQITEIPKQYGSVQENLMQFI